MTVTPSRVCRGLILLAVFAAAIMVLGEAALAQPPDYGFRWATITHPNNPAYPGAPDDDSDQMRAIGRGSVPHVYRISTTEIGTSEWLEFVNTFSVQADFPRDLFGTRSFVNSPPQWGAGRDGAYAGPGLRYIPFSAATLRRPAYGISWREAAMYCNWLHNGKSSDRASLFSGAYDTSTWDSDGIPPYTDAVHHEPGARFWIPSFDEWTKAAYWDPAKLDRAGWWTWANASDSPPIPGFPGDPGATTSAGLPDVPLGSPNDPRLIPLESYPTALSPWGLLDTASGASEWNELGFSDGPSALIARGYMGASAWDNGTGRARLTGSMGTDPVSGIYSFRIASTVASPSSALVLAFVAAFLSRRKR